MVEKRLHYTRGMETEHHLALELLPEELHNQAWIAGSAAIEPASARDLDVWVLNLNAGPDVDGFASVIRDAVENDPDSPLTYERHMTDYPELATYGVRRLGTVKGPGMKPISFYASEARTPDQLVERFDISTHAYAVPLVTELAHELVRVAHPQATKPGAPIRVLTFQRPFETLCRLSRILMRYHPGSDLSRHIDVPRLLSEATAKAASGITLAA